MMEAVEPHLTGDTPVAPGAQEISEGRISDAGKSVFVEATPLSVSGLISAYFGWLYDTAHDDLEYRKKHGKKIFP